MSSTIPRFLLPRGAPLSYHPIPRSLSRRPCRKSSSASSSSSSSSSSTPQKPIVLEKPTKFNPPSHPQRLRQAAPRRYGPSLSAEEKVEQRSKQYPNMMPAEGTFMRWFLTNKAIHMWISLSTLSALALFTLTTNFKRTTPYVDLLPTWSAFFAHPLAAGGQAVEVYKLHTAHVTAQTAERRRRKLEEVQKRKAYRVAHGLEEPAEADAPAAAAPVGAGAGPGPGPGPGAGDEYVDFEGRRRPLKKWFGIW